jgi:hypothetical protein
MNALRTLPPILVLAACDVEPSGPLGPSGGENRFRVLRGDDKETFEAVSLTIAGTSTRTVTLQLSGSVDPIEQAIDDEYALHLDVEIDRAALAAASAPVSLTVKGTTTFSYPADDLVLEHHMDPASSAMLNGLFFRRSCFCLDAGSGEQSYDGVIEVSALSEDEITGTLRIHVTGDVPNEDGAVDVILEAELNLAIP